MKTDQNTVELLRQIVQECARSRIWFIENVLGVVPNAETGEVGIEAWQREVLEALDNGETRISIRSGHGVGKTTLCAWIALHFLLFRNNVKIPVTAPSSSQMRDGLIPEINKWMRKLPRFLKKNLNVISDRIERNPDPKNHFISFRTARAETPEALAGIHADHVLVLVDEASGVPEPVYEAAQGTMSTQGAIIILIGNPTRTGGFFHKTQTKLANRWFVRRIRCQDSTRVSPTFIQSIIETYGENSNQYRIRVLGEFPEGEDDTVIPRILIESAVGRDVAPSRGDVKVWGLDPGRGGDPSGFVERCGTRVTDLVEWNDADTMRVVGRVKERWDKLPNSERPEHIFIDCIGLGAGVADRLRELGLPVYDVNVSEAPSMKERYQNLRAELWYNGREFLEARNCSLPADHRLTEKLVNELATPIATFSSNGKSGVEPKAMMKQRGFASPNLADAFLLTFALGGATANGRVSGGGSWSKSLDYTPVNVV